MKEIKAFIHRNRAAEVLPVSIQKLLKEVNYEQYELALMAARNSSID